MKQNMGSLDKGIRITIAVVIALLFFTNSIVGPVAYVLLGLAIIFVLTSFMGLCPLYLPFGIQTCKNKN